MQRLSDRAPVLPAVDLNNIESVEAHVRLREYKMGQIAETHRRISQLRDHLKLQLQLANNYASSLEYAYLPDLLGRDAAREQEYLKDPPVGHRGSQDRRRCLENRQEI